MSDKRLFFALWPTDRQRETLRDPIKAAAGSVEGQLVPRGDWHVTLNFIGPFPADRVAALAEAAGAISVEPFRLRLDRLEFWPRPKIACLLAAAVPPELARLKEQLEIAAADFGCEPDDRSYRPHITVARNARPFAAEPLARAITLEWSGFALVASESGGRGMRYSPLKQWSTPIS